jgi:hypothetical protein
MGTKTTASSNPNTSTLSANGFLRLNREPRFTGNDGFYGSSANRVLTQDLVQIMRSKQDIYKILTVTGQKIVTFILVG